MDAFLIMVRNVILFAALAVPGYLLVKCKILKQEHSAALSKMLMYVGMPFLILSGTVNNLTISSEFIIRLLVGAAIGIAYTFGMYFISTPLTAFEKADKTRRMMRFCSVFSNNGFLGIPLAVAVFGKGTEIFTVLIVLNIITNVMMYVLGSSLIAGEGHKISIKTVLLNPVLIAFVVGLILNQNVVCATFYDGNRAYQCELCLLLELCNAQSTTVTHCRTDLAECDSEVVMESTCIGNVAVNTFNE